MKILVAKTAGFCMGVRRAVELALDVPARHPGPIYTYGPLIHNPQVLELFAEKGITILDHIPEHGSGTVLVRAHGVPPSARQRLKAAGFQVIDATCPRVIKVQSIIKRHTRKGFATIIIGDADHPEVVGLYGHAGDQGHVVASLAELEALPVFEQAIIVAQTTQNTTAYEQIKRWAAEYRPHYKIFDTICDSTEKRQREVQRLAAQVDALIVVGGKSSGNTQRLAETARQCGKPAYHIETEDELDPQAIGRMPAVGITAGASTPSWIIKRVYRGLEQLPLKQTRGWGPLILNAQRFLLLTNLYVALGAGCLAYACSLLIGVRSPWSQVLTAVLYVLSMHLLNHLTGRAEDKYNDPDRERFYRRHKTVLAVLAFAAGAAGLVAAFHMGVLPFWVLLAMSLLGLSYNLRWMPTGTKLRRIRDVPGSKTLLIALAWGVVTALLPALSLPGPVGPAMWVVFVWSSLLVFSRTAFFDMLDMQGDRIVGKETLPILLGEATTLKMLKVVLLVIVAGLPVAAALQVVSLLAVVLSVCPLFLLLTIVIHQKGQVLPGIRLEFQVESLFVLAGVISAVWAGFGGLV